MAKTKPKIPLVDRSEESVNAAIQVAIPEGGIFWDYLTLIRLDSNFGVTEFDRGKIEGMRELAGVLQDKASGVFEANIKRRADGFTGRNQ